MRSFCARESSSLNYLIRPLQEKRDYDACPIATINAVCKNTYLLRDDRLKPKKYEVDLERGEDAYSHSVLLLVSDLCLEMILFDASCLLCHRPRDSR